MVFDTLNSHQSWKIRSTCVTKVRCPFLTSWTLSFNFKIGLGIWESHLLLKRKSNHQITVLFVITYSTVIFYPRLTASEQKESKKYLMWILESLLIIRDKSSLSRNINSAPSCLFDKVALGILAYCTLVYLISLVYFILNIITKFWKRNSLPEPNITW